MSAEFTSAIEQAALIAENWASPMRPGSDNRLLGQLETGKEIASAIRQLTAAPATPCPCGDNDGLWCSLPGCPYPKQSRIFLPSDPAPSQQMTGDQHPDDIAVDRFAAAMKAKLAKKRADGTIQSNARSPISASFSSSTLRRAIPSTSATSP